MPRLELPARESRTPAAGDGGAGAEGMVVELSAEQEALRHQVRSFVDERVAPHAGRWDREERIDEDVTAEVIRRGWLGSLLPQEVGGGGIDPVSYGLLTEEIGRGCSSLRSLLTVHDMVGVALARWGSAALKEEYLGALARGELTGALALSEPTVGSDAKRVTTAARRDGGDWVLDGTKLWITYGVTADLVLTIAAADDGLAAVLVPADAPGFSRAAIPGLVGTRAARIARLTFDGCRVPERNLVGRVGFGFSHVAATALDQGRYSVAWGAVGVAQACLDASLDYTAERHQFGVPIRDHQLVQRMLTDLIVETRASRLLCYRAGHLRRRRDPAATAETLIAKYHASRTAVRAALDAVQLHGAHGVTQAYPVERYLRDAKVTEIIEGSTQILQGLIPRYPLPEL